MESQVVVLVPFPQREHYDNPLKDWGAVPERFNAATSEAIEESEKCFALGRNTACVFHLMAVMNEGLMTLAKHLPGTKVDPYIDTWENLIGEIETGVKNKRTALGPLKWKRVEAFYEEALSDLRSVKNAWRNPTMHFRRTYTEPQAAKVLSRVKDFMAHLATKLKGRR